MLTKFARNLQVALVLREVVLRVSDGSAPRRVDFLKADGSGPYDVFVESDGPDATVVASGCWGCIRCRTRQRSEIVGLVDDIIRMLSVIGERQTASDPTLSGLPRSGYNHRETSAA